MQDELGALLSELREQLHYDPETGIFTWKVSKSGPGIKPGREAGTTHVKGYRRITLCCKDYLAHHLAWLYMTGEWPPYPDMVVDHINRDKADNRWSNLRLLTHGENQVNSERYGKARGVQQRGPNSFRVRIAKGRERKHIGTFTSYDEAKAAYDAAFAKMYGGIYAA